MDIEGEFSRIPTQSENEVEQSRAVSIRYNKIPMKTKEKTRSLSGMVQNMTK